MLEGLICTFGKPNAKARGAEGGAGGKINGLLSYKGFVLLPINPRALVAVIEPVWVCSLVMAILLDLAPFVGL